MTELEKQLLSAFENLSNQYATEQKRQAAQIDDLSKQVQSLGSLLGKLSSNLAELLES